MEISIVVPVRDEEDNVGPLVDEIDAALRPRDAAYEIIFIDDGSRDGTADALRGARQRCPSLRVIRHAQSCGQSGAIRSGVDAARGALVGTLDGDGQNDPADLPRLFDQLAAANAGAHRAVGMVSGERVKRHDRLHRRIASRLANGVRSRLLHDGARDTGCGIKVFYRDAFLRLPYFDHMHRFMPALMAREGYAVQFVAVNHRPRQHGRSKYRNLSRLGVGIVDLIGVMWLRRRARRITTITEEE